MFISFFHTCWWRLQRDYVMAALHCLHLSPRPGSDEHSASTWRVWSQMWGTHSILKGSWGWSVIPTNRSYGLQYFSLYRKMRGRVRGRRINCECPRRSSLIQQVSPWSSEECVCCSECCCSHTTHFSRPQLRRNQWKKVDGENTFRVNAGLFWQQIASFLETLIFQIPTVNFKSVLNLFVRGIRYIKRCCSCGSTETNRRHRPGAQPAEGAAGAANR